MHRFARWWLEQMWDSLHALRNTVDAYVVSQPHLPAFTSSIPKLCSAVCSSPDNKVCMKLDFGKRDNSSSSCSSSGNTDSSSSTAITTPIWVKPGLLWKLSPSGIPMLQHSVTYLLDDSKDLVKVCLVECEAHCLRPAVAVAHMQQALNTACKCYDSLHASRTIQAPRCILWMLLY